MGHMADMIMACMVPVSQPDECDIKVTTSLSEEGIERWELDVCDVKRTVPSSPNG